jgi:translation elongation factor EF-4
MVEIENALMAPDEGEVAHYEEPLAEATILCPNDYVS